MSKASDVLNKAFSEDSNAIYCLVVNRVPCNEDLASNEFIIVEENKVLEGEQFTVGLLGIINGVLDANGLPMVAPKWEMPEDGGPGRLVGFQDYEVEPPVDPPEEKVLECPLGWNVGPQHYFSTAKWHSNIFETAVWHPAPNATFNCLGDPVSGDLTCYLLVDNRRFEPGEYVFSIPSGGKAKPDHFTVEDSSTTKTLKIVLSGDCSGLTCSKDGATGLTPTFLERTKNASCLRLMDLLWTNRGEPVKSKDCFWVNRTDGGQFFPTKILRPSQAHALATTTNSDIWWCFHHTDLEIEGRVEFICDKFRDLGGDYTIYFEHSNEVWNGIFPSHKWLAELKDRNWIEVWKEHGRRTNEIGRIAKSILGDRAKIVLGSQAANAWITKQALSTQDISYIDSVGIAPYFGGTVKGGATKTVAQILDEIRAEKPTVENWILSNKKNAEEFGKSLVAYEGGSHLWGHSKEDDKKYYEVNRTPELAEIYWDYLKFWDDNVGGLYLAYNDCYHGVFGHQEFERGVMQPRGQFILDNMEKYVGRTNNGN